MEKKQLYEEMLPMLTALCDGTNYVTTNCANMSALLYDALPDLNWAGFYLMADGALQLGPFCGKTACLTIPIGKGVCGTAAQKRETVVVQDVHDFPGHIACDSASNSEIVVPILQNGTLYGVLDIDSPIKHRFDETDAKYLKQAVEILLASSDWEHFALR